MAIIDSHIRTYLGCVEVIGADSTEQQENYPGYNFNNFQHIFPVHKNDDSVAATRRVFVTQNSPFCGRGFALNPVGEFRYPDSSPLGKETALPFPTVIDAAFGVSSINFQRLWRLDSRHAAPVA